MAPKKMKVENVEEENPQDMTEDVQTIPKPNISRIKNKILRNEMYKKLRVEKRKVIVIIIHYFTMYTVVSVYYSIMLCFKT